MRVRLQLAVSYGLGLSAFLAAVTTIVLAAGAISRDLESRRLHVVLTKPIAPWQLVLGKLLALAAVDAVLVLAAYGVFLANALLLARSAGGQENGQAAEGELETARQRFFTAREAVLPELPAIPGDDLRRLIERLRAGGTAGASLAPAGLEELARRTLRSIRLGPGSSASLIFRGLPRGSGPRDELLVRCVVHSSRPASMPRIDVELEAEGAGNAGRRTLTQVLQGAPQEVSLPAAATREDGTLVLRVRNPAREDVTLVIDPARVEALPVEGSFSANVLRSALLVLGRLFLLAAVCVLAGTAFSFPTAAFCGLFLYSTAIAAGFLRETLALVAGSDETGSLLERLHGWLAPLARAALALLPDFSGVDPLFRLVEGRRIGVAEVAGELAWSLGVEALGAVVLAAWLLRRRELGA